MMNEEKTYCYYSNVLKKPFETLESLKKAEKEFEDAELAKQAVVKGKKLDASKVEEAFKELNAVKKESNKAIKEAEAEFLKIVTEAKKKYSEKYTAETKKIETKHDAYNQALTEFNNKHPEGYHVTLRDGDIVKTISRSNICDDFDDLFYKIARFMF